MNNPALLKQVWISLLLCWPFLSMGQDKSFADHWQYVGVAVSEPGYTIWGTSPILDPSGRVHLFVARWPGNRVDPEWRSISEIAHYVGDKPEGPFTFSDVVLRGSGEHTWDGFGPHNPAIHKVGDRYVLLYIANDNPLPPVHPANQKIGMMTSNSLNGPWQKVNGSGLVLDVPQNPDYWNYAASNGVNNPAFLIHPDGGYWLYFKSEKARMGLAFAENLEGPYVQLPWPVTSNDKTVEDGYAFRYAGKFALLTTDNHGMIEEGGGILWTSEDGIHFNDFEKGMHRLSDYYQGGMQHAKVYYGPQDRDYAKLERPQILLIDDQPAYLYAPSGTNILGGNQTVSYVFRYEP